MQESTMTKPVQEEIGPYAVEMRDIYKAWPGVVANNHVHLAVRKCEIHALVGENGAGKSTLMNILYGLIHPDSGEILINGTPVTINGPRDAIRLGIGMVHQHFMLIPPLTVAENIILGREPGGLSGSLNLKKARADIQALSQHYGLPINPDARIADLSVGLQQRVEILKVLARGADILVMDEPTGVLTPQETDDLFAVLRGLVQQDKTIIFITHKLREVLQLTDRITVLRRGKNAGELITRETNRAEVAWHLAHGHPDEEQRGHPAEEENRVRIEAEDDRNEHRGAEHRDDMLETHQDRLRPRQAVLRIDDAGQALLHPAAVSRRPSGTRSQSTRRSNRSSTKPSSGPATVSVNQCQPR